MSITFDDGESMVVLLPEKSFNRFFTLLQSQRGKRIAILSFSYNPVDHTMMFRDVGTMVLIQNVLGEMVIPQCNYGPHSKYMEPATAVSRFTGSKRLHSEVDDVTPPAPSPMTILSGSAAARSPATVAPSPGVTILRGSAAAVPLDYANLDRASLIELLAKMVASKPFV
jgi:hypothetical protein